MRARPPMLLIATAAILTVSTAGCEAKVYGSLEGPSPTAGIPASPETPHRVRAAAFDELPARI
ncbi:MAG: hypothetical protein WBS15_07665, partial [Mycobacterium sp.]